jgi:DNA (cytosine-5)-methyltransferase 1
MEKPYRVGELFAGIGGIGLGLERTGAFKVVWQVENNKYATDVLKKHWADVPRWGDVRTFPPEPKGWGCDFITAGFPCQDISAAGLGKGLDGERSGLFYEVIRILTEVQPKYVLLENVAALLYRGLGKVLSSLYKIGYSSEWYTVRASDVGAPHKRERVFIFAYADDTRTRTPRSNNNEARAQAIERRKEYAQSKLSGYSEALPDADSFRRKRRAEKPLHGVEDLQGKFERSREGFGKLWATGAGVCRVADGVPYRLDRIRVLGNAVVPQVAEFMGRLMLERIKEL